MDIINQLKTYSYNLKTDSINFSEKISYGLIAQEVEIVLPEIVDSSKGIKLINYDEFIPFLILSIQEQQAQIETLKSIVFSQEKEIVSLNTTVSNCCGQTIPKNTDTQDSKQLNALLFQNSPNPFTESTLISFILPESFSEAKIIIHNLNGVEIKSYPISLDGEGNITISGAELNPGMYLYTLIVDKQIIDTKRMILTN